jgi:hypothetical protein
MASSKETVDFIVDQLSRAGEIIAKRMFGEYGIYVDGKMAAVVADDQLFVKPTAPGKAYLGHAGRGAALSAGQAVVPHRRRTLGRPRMAGRPAARHGAGAAGAGAEEALIAAAASRPPRAQAEGPGDSSISGRHRYMYRLAPTRGSNIERQDT